MGYCLAKMLSCWVKDLRSFVDIWDKKCPISNEKSLKKLGIKKYKTMDKSLVEMGYALIKLGNIVDKTKGK